jgi:hypothetical protein
MNTESSTTTDSDPFPQAPLCAYVRKHMVQGDCKCGKCLPPVLPKPDPTGHTVNMVFFVAAMIEDANTKKLPTVEEFKRLTTEHRGEFSDCNPLDSTEHGYIELGGWLGDQGVALLYMALGVRLGIFQLLSPWTMMPRVMTEATAQEMAGRGMLTIKAKPVLAAVGA